MQRRQQLHAQMGLPPDRPLLRIANALVFREPGCAAAAATSGRSPRLMDVHVGLPPSGVPGGSAHMVDGSYDYYHYMQVAPRWRECYSSFLLCKHFSSFWN